MAQQCFCGCDEPVKGFASRGHNKQGRRTVEQVEKLKALKDRSLLLSKEMGELEEVLPGSNTGSAGTDSANALVELARSLDEWVDNGDDYAETWHEILHDDYIPIEGAMDYKRAWFAWGKVAMTVTSMLKVSDEKLITFALAATDDAVQA